MMRRTHLGDKNFIQAVRVSKLYAMNISFLARVTVGLCKVCQKVNAYAAKSNQDKRPRGEQPGVYWAVNFTEVRPRKYG